MRAFLRQLRPAFVVLAAMTVLCGFVYPMAVTAVTQVAFHDKANGSLAKHNGKPVGSRLLGQSFVGSQWFHPRPSAAGSGYDAMASSGSNLGPLSPEFLKAIAKRVATYRSENGLAADASVPVDAVTASGSGLDPQISVANARLQVRRIAAARKIDESVVMRAINSATAAPAFGFLGDGGVNVLLANLALDEG